MPTILYDMIVPMNTHFPCPNSHEQPRKLAIAEVEKLVASSLLNNIVERMLNNIVGPIINVAHMLHDNVAQVLFRQQSCNIHLNHKSASMYLSVQRPLRISLLN